MKLQTYMNLLFELVYMKGEVKDTEISALFTGEGRRKKGCEAGTGKIA